ncbi:MAG: hypothetical protein ACK587_13820 [Cyanobacteriota bacterium]
MAMGGGLNGAAFMELGTGGPRKRLISPRELQRRYLSHTSKRIGVRGRAQAIGWCEAHGLIRPVGVTTAVHTSGPKPAGKRSRWGSIREPCAGGE